MRSIWHIRNEADPIQSVLQLALILTIRIDRFAENAGQMI
jgi:hypothetical protein